MSYKVINCDFCGERYSENKMSKSNFSGENICVNCSENLQSYTNCDNCCVFFTKNN